MEGCPATLSPRFVLYSSLISTLSLSFYVPDTLLAPLRPLMTPPQLNYSLLSKYVAEAEAIANAYALISSSPPQNILRANQICSSSS